MQLALAISRREQPVSDMANEIKKVLAAVELPNRAASALPSELSGGMPACCSGHCGCAKPKS